MKNNCNYLSEKVFFFEVFEVSFLNKSMINDFNSSFILIMFLSFLEMSSNQLFNIPGVSHLQSLASKLDLSCQIEFCVMIINN